MNSVMDPRDAVLVRRTEMRALLLLFQHLATRPERIEGLAALYTELSKTGLLDTYIALEAACRLNES